MTTANAEWVCAVCKNHKHNDCEGTLEDLQGIVDFCECGLCKLRFALNIRKTLQKSQEKRASE